jgi:stress-induced morphogen
MFLGMHKTNTSGEWSMHEIYLKSDSIYVYRQSGNERVKLTIQSEEYWGQTTLKTHNSIRGILRPNNS